MGLDMWKVSVPTPAGTRCKGSGTASRWQQNSQSAIARGNDKPHTAHCLVGSKCKFSKKDWNGGAKGNRTPDLYNAIVALSQLSYGPMFHMRAGLGAGVDGGGL